MNKLLIVIFIYQEAGWIASVIKKRLKILSKGG